MKGKRIAFITGVTGQDGSYLSELLLSKNYEVHGLIRRSSSFNRERIEHLYDYKNQSSEDFYLHYGDMTDTSNIIRLLEKIQPDEIYNLAAQSHVHVSFDVPEYTANADALGTLRILEAIRILGLEKKVRFYQASTSEMYGKVQEIPQNENTPFYPRSPYGVAKLYGFWITKNYREAYNLYACSGILFNHESPRRGENFVTRKIALSAVNIFLGKQDILSLGNINALRDWGYAGDFVEAMWLMLQQKVPQDYVIATGEMHSVKEFVEESFLNLGVELKWLGAGIKTKAVVNGVKSKVNSTLRKGDVVVNINPKYFRPTDVDQLLGNPEKANNELGWAPRMKFKELVKLMVETELDNEIKKNGIN